MNYFIPNKINTVEKVKEILKSNKIISTINPDRIYRRTISNIGHSPRTKRGLEQIIPNLISTSKPNFTYDIYQSKQSDDGIILNNIKLKSKRIRAAFEYCSCAIVYCMTLGFEIDKIIKSKRTQSKCLSYLCDQSASRFAELLVENFREQIKCFLSDSLGITECYSPGYCDWDLSDQHKIFDLLTPNQTGIKINNSCLMSPRKSMSGIIGVGHPLLTHICGNACLDCADEKCDHRRPLRHHG